MNKFLAGALTAGLGLACCGVARGNVQEREQERFERDRMANYDRSNFRRFDLRPFQLDRNDLRFFRQQQCSSAPATIDRPLRFRKCYLFSAGRAVQW